MAKDFSDATEEKNSDISRYSIGFYNVENLFDTEDDPDTLDDDFTVHSEKNWTEKRFRKKIRKLGKVISKIGYEKIDHPPVLLGLAEVENSEVLDALLDTKFLREKGYDYVHFDSPDERGIDTALLFRKKYFSVKNTETHTVYLVGEYGERDYTRDVLYVHGELEGQPVHVLVNHWPSRRKGTRETAHKRITASEKNLEIMNTIYSEDPNARIVVMGDFNDDPTSDSVKRLSSAQMYNPMELLLTHAKGTLNYQDQWHLFDQIIISHNFLRGYDNSFRFEEANIFDPEFVKEYKGKYKGHPFRTYVGKKHLGGYSDHFPVYAIFSIH
ncbi:MAG: endonuclease/exonuclease/phosphatase family protein [Bacteroidota bacterium]